MPESRAKPLTDSALDAMIESPTNVRLGQSQVMSIRLSAAELRKLADEAARSEMTVGALIKRAALDAAESRKYSSKPEAKFGFSVSGQGVSGTQGMPRYTVAASVGASAEYSSSAS
ncbi:MAG: hypothetical protein ACRDG3_04305 [Tepidiformaceae bacterium]